jgi:ribosomal protein S18 acetylase RimI-like enzyme
VAEDAGDVVGLAGVLRYGRVLELEPIVVAERARGRGAGHALVEAALAYARERASIRLVVRPTGRNADAIRFFHACGFDVIGRVDLQYELEPRERCEGETIAERRFRV